jgi:hypothetical protein
VIKKTIKTAIKISSALLAFVSVLILALFLWIYTGPRSVPLLTDYLRQNISELLPHTISIYVEDVLLGFDEDFRIRLRLTDFRVIDEPRGEFTTSDISVIVDPLALFPQTHHNLLNVQINGPAMVYNALKERLDNSPIPVQQINDYLNSHKETLLKFSLSLTDTKFDVDICQDKAAVINVNEIVLKPTLVKDKLLFALYGDFNIGGKNNVMEATIDTSSNKHLTVKGTVTNLSNFTLEEFGLKLPELTNANVELDLTFTALLKGTRSIDYIEFEGSNFDGLIRANDFFNKDIKISSLQLNGYCNNNCQEVYIEKLNVKADKLNLKSTAEYRLISGHPTFFLNFQLGAMPTNMIDYYWPKSLVSRTRDWVFEHIKEGTLKSAKGALKLDFTELAKKNLKNSKVSVDLELDGTSIKYLDHVLPITDIDANININLNDVKFSIKKALISNSLIEKATGKINDLGSSKSTVNIEAKVVGDVQDLIDLSFQHAELKNDELKGIEGLATADLKVTFPIREEDLEIEDIGISARAKVKKASMEKVYKSFGFSNGEFDVFFDNFVVVLVGKALVESKFNADIAGEYKLLSKQKSVKIKSLFNWDSIGEFGITKPNFINHNFNLTLELQEDKKGSKKFLTADLHGSAINYEPLGIKKEIGEPGFLRVMLEDSSLNDTASTYNITDYYLSLPKLESKGTGIVSKDLDIETIHSSYTKLGKGDFKFDFARKDKSCNITITGNSLDLSDFKPMGSEGHKVRNNDTITNNKPGYYNVSAKVGMLYLKNDQFITEPLLKAQIDEGIIKELRLAGNMGNNSTVNLNVKYPIVSLTSNNAGKVTKAFGITNKIEGGDLNLHGKMNGKNFDGTIEIKEYRMRKAPILAKLFSVVSITTTSLEGLSNIFGNQGVKFDKLQCPVRLQSGIVELHECYTKGPSLTFTANGTIDFNADTVKIKGSVLPENIINTAVKNIPIIGSAFSGKKGHGFFGASYTMEGSIDDPTVSSNPLSLLAPGALRDVF